MAEPLQVLSQANASAMNAQSVAHFDLVWLSTDAQIGALTEAYRRVNLATKLLGRFDLPHDAAYVRSFLIPWARLPLVFVAQGRLTVDERTVAFTPCTHRMLAGGCLAFGPISGSSIPPRSLPPLNRRTWDRLSGIFSTFPSPVSAPRTRRHSTTSFCVSAATSQCRASASRALSSGTSF
jgi:hypothetical protein